MKAALSGMFEVQASQVASARASASEVKAFATMLVNDHTQAANELAEDTALANLGIRHNVAEVPDLGAFADVTGDVNIGGRMSVITS